MNLSNNKNNIKFSILAIILIVIFAFALSPKTLQNDTFYTIKIGELIVNNGIDMKDHFSEHEGLPYTYPHWAYDTGMYLIYNLGENSGIPDGGMIFIYASTVILTGILGILVYLTCTKITKNRLLSFIMSLVVLYLLGSFIAARAQLVTFILFTLTILFIESFIQSKKKRYLFGIVLISIVIANVHVAVWPFFFILFMPYIAEYILTKYIIQNVKILLIYQKESKYNKQLKKNPESQDIKNKIAELEAKITKIKENTKNNINEKEPYKITTEYNSAVKYLLLVMIICIFTGFLTPLQDTPYTYLIKTMQGNTTQSISEHLPLTLFNDYKTAIALVATIALLVFTRTKIKLRDLFMIGGLIFLGFMSRRQTSMLFLIGSFTFAKLVDYLFNKYDKDGCQDLLDIAITNTGKVVVIFIVVMLSLYFYVPKKDSEFINDRVYPVEAATWMLENLDVNEIKLFNEYNYGSYLLFRGIPVFIDSRADLYAPEFNGGRDIFSDYMNTSNVTTYYEDKLDSYDITHVIVGKRTRLNMFMSRDDRYTELYNDDNFVIYQRNK